MTTKHLVNLEVTVHLAPLHKRAFDFIPDTFDTLMPSNAIDLAIVDATEPLVTVLADKVTATYTLCLETSLSPQAALEAYQKNACIDWSGRLVNGDDWESIMHRAILLP